MEETWSLSHNRSINAPHREEQCDLLACLRNTHQYFRAPGQSKFFHIDSFKRIGSYRERDTFPFDLKRETGYIQIVSAFEGVVPFEEVLFTQKDD